MNRVSPITKNKIKKTNESTIVNIGADIGFNQIKIISSAKPESIIKIPSAVKPLKASKYKDKMLSEDEIRIDKLTVIVEGEMYAVGEHVFSFPSSDTVRKFVKDRGNHNESRVLFRTALAYACPDEEGSYQINLVTGLPNDDIGEEIQETLEEFLLEDFTIGFSLPNGRIIEKHISIVRVDEVENTRGLLIIPQPMGTLLKNQFKFSREMSEEDILYATGTYARRIGIIDIGHFTTDIGQFVKNQYISDEGISNSYKGVQEIYKRMSGIISSYLKKQGFGDYTLVDEDLDKFIRTGIFKYADGEFDFKEELGIEKMNFAQRIVDYILPKWTNINQLDRIIFTGGGAELLKEELEALFNKHKIKKGVVAEESDSANVYGYYLHAALNLVESELASVDEVFEHYVPDFMLSKER